MFSRVFPELMVDATAGAKHLIKKYSHQVLAVLPADAIAIDTPKDDEQLQIIIQSMQL